MITIIKNPNGDSRTARQGVTFKEFQESNDMHRQDVKNIMDELAINIEIKGANHDYTKKTEEELFYKEFTSTMISKTDFLKSEWYKLHTQKERHHLLSRCPDDVNLLDVLEMIADCVCAGIARSGEVRSIEIDEEILMKALNNTTELIKNMVEGVDTN